MDAITVAFPLPPEVWDSLHPTAQALLLLQQERIAALEAQVVALQTRILELEARLGQNSSNSSRPPSSDFPKPPPRQTGPTGRRPGGQPGHEAHQRGLLPPEQVDAVIDHWPERCRHCQTPLPADPSLAAADPERHQVTEVPPLRATVTEHRFQRVRCAQCGEETRAAWPAQVPRGAFGPRLQAVVALLSGRYRLSRREVASVCDEVLGAAVALGSVAGLCQDTAAALAGPMAQLEQALPAVAALPADETPWRQAGKKRWLWVVVGTAVAVFRIAGSRGSVVIKGLLGEDFAGRLTSDRYAGYSWLALCQRQLCCAGRT